MFKVKYVNDLRNVIGKKGKVSALKGVAGFYVPHNETIYIPKKMPRWMQRRVFRHELVHWLIDKLCFGRMRFQYYWDMWCADSKAARKYYKRQYKRVKKLCPFRYSKQSKLYKW